MVKMVACRLPEPNFKLKIWLNHLNPMVKIGGGLFGARCSFWYLGSPKMKGIATKRYQVESQITNPNHWLNHHEGLDKISGESTGVSMKLQNEHESHDFLTPPPPQKKKETKLTKSNFDNDIVMMVWVCCNDLWFFELPWDINHL